MSEQDGTPSSTQQRRSRKTSTANQQNSKQVPAAQRPADDDPEAWKAYWREQGQFWRTEPEIDAERQAFLAERRKITPDFKQGIYPFKDVKLGRADIEWLLAMHEKGREPVEWNDESQPDRGGIDLRGADLRRVDLSNLPLAGMHGGLNVDSTEEQCNLAATHLEGADLRGANLTRAILLKIHLEGANLEYAHLEGADLLGAHLEGVHCCRTFFDAATRLNDITISDEEHGFASIGDVSWNGVNLTVVDWSSMKMLGYEHQAYQKKTNEGKIKTSNERLSQYKQAMRANRQLAVVLRDQGMNEEADHFSYRAQILQRTAWRLQRRSLKYIFSWFLDLLSGYGYKPIRSIIAYIIVIIGFAIAYFAFGHMPLLEAFVFSLTSFHGRGFFPGSNISLSDLRVVVAAFEAVVGLLIEISFIATFTQRFFGK